MSSELFKLQVPDFLKGLVVAIFAAVVTWLASVVNVPGFEIASLDLAELLRIAIAAGVAYLSKNFISDSKGKVLGQI